jgi:holo-[acyl-carrier protein] synthase
MIGIGLDTVDVARFREVLARRPRLVERVFTQAERLECERRADPVPGLAARFAAKEATMKALGVGLGAFALHDVEVVRGDSGAPSLSTSGQAAVLVARAGIDLLFVTMTHSGLVASAVVVAT